MTSMTQHAFTYGKYLITPLTRQRENGRFTSVVSIRCGRGSETRDKIYTFIHQFKSQETALMYAASKGREWLDLKNLPT
ncbi:hypothetical protein HV832_02470 [Undibacterium oligocarboniphilum]|uniref:Uncharacterized protein n=2 Tax=Undibacterium oligocarboniphilum TaxID=666702 RepID=A0A850QAU3_9BURK|nr:hypothetical protein [Undibacterium oligocarboniphilum]NVO76701.1 hypothetical protein [Undibacterium oligocarboniphilum]